MAGGNASVTAYGGNPAWTGLALISGRWYSARTAEADVNLFLTGTATSVGSTYTLVSGGHRVAVRIVGEVFAPGRDYGPSRQGRRDEQRPDPESGLTVRFR